MATVQDAIVNPALRELRVYGAGEVPTFDDANDAFTRLNQFLRRLELEKNTIYSVARTTWSITASTGQYDIGSGGTVDIERPIFVERIGYIDTDADPDYEYPLRELNETEWQNVRTKARTDTVPTAYYYNPTFSSSAATVDFVPVPTDTGLSGVIYHWTAVPQFAALTTTVSLPPGYEEMLITNLAVILAPQFGATPHPVTVETARQTLADIKRVNRRPVEVEFEASASFRGRRRVYDITQG